MKYCKKGIAILLSCLLFAAPLSMWPVQTQAASVYYSEDFDGYNDGDLPGDVNGVSVTSVENASKKLYTRVEKSGDDGVLHTYCAPDGEKGGPQMRVHLDARNVAKIVVTYLAKSDGTSNACLNFRNADVNKQVSYVNSNIWTEMKVVIDLIYMTYSEIYDSVAKMNKPLGVFDENSDLSSVYLAFSAGTVQPGGGAYFDDIVIKVTYKDEMEHAPYEPVVEPPKSDLPSGVHTFVDTDFSDMRAGFASSTSIFSATVDTVKIADAGENRLLRFWEIDNTYYIPYVTFKLPTQVNTYELDMNVLLGGDASLYFATYVNVNSDIDRSDSITAQSAGYIADAWNRVHLSVDLNNNTMTVFLNGETAQTVALSHSAYNRRSLGVRIGATLEEGEAVYIDNLSLYTTENYTSILNGVNQQIIYENVKPAKALGQDSFVNNLKDHPRLFVRDWEDTKAKIASSELTQVWYNTLKAAADNALATKPVAYNVNDRGNILESARKARDRIMPLAFVYKITGEQKYLDRAYEEMLVYGAWPDWSGFVSSLVTAEILQGYAYCYDWLYYDLTAAQRLEIENIVKAQALPDFIHNYEGVRTNTNFTTSSINWNPVCNATVIAWALASADDSPLISEYILEKVPPLIQYALPPYAPEGAYPEGVSYWDYGTSFLIFATDFLENAFVQGFELPDDYIYWKAPGIAQTADYAIYFDGPAGRFNYGDCVKGHTNSVIMYWLANRFNKPYYAWWQDNRQTSTGSYLDGYDAVAALAWYDPDNAYYVNGAFSLDKYYTAQNAFNGAAMRSSWDEPTALYAAIQGGKNKENHQHLSLGTYIVDYMGKRFVRVMDYYSYAVSGTKADLYYKRAESYNTLVVNPSAAADQKEDAVATIIDSYSGNGTAYVKLDLTDTNDDLVSYTRGLMMSNGRSRVIVQDEAVAAEPSEFYWFANTDAAIDIAADGKSAVLTLGDDKMLARIVDGPAEAKFDIMDRKSLIGSVNNVGISEGEKLFIHVENTKTLNLTVEYVPLTDDETPSVWKAIPLENWETYKADKAITTRTVQDGRITFTTELLDAPQSAYVAVALYDDQNKMVAVKMQNCGTRSVVTNTFENVAYTSAKVMLMESIFSMRLLDDVEVY